MIWYFPPFSLSLYRNQKKGDTIMKTNVEKVKDVKEDWLLKLSRKVCGGSYESRYLSYWDLTEEEILAIADSYTSCDIIVRVYKLETVLRP